MNESGYFQVSPPRKKSHNLPTNTYLAAQFRRLSARRGGKRAAVAVAHSMLVIGYHLILRNTP